jgi:Fic family protein
VKELLKKISEKKTKLDSLRPLPPELEKNLYDWFKVALTYTSNAIEGNTLSLAETAQIVEKQITVGGKSITEHLEALNHAQAVDFVKRVAQEKKRQHIQEADILAIHKIILQKINDEWAGRFRAVPVRVVGSLVPCPNYVKVPALIDELLTFIHSSNEHSATIASYAHLQLAAIHPFVDGNGRTARLLMNLLLLQEDYPLIIVDEKERTAYISAIQKALQGEADNYYHFMYTTIEKSLDRYLEAVTQ